MPTFNMHEAKSQLSRLVEAVEQGEEAEIVIARNGRPAARLVPIEATPAGVRIGVARGEFVAPDDIDALNGQIADLFAGNKGR